MLGALKALCAHAGRKHYVFLMGKLNAAKLANFPEVGVYVLLGSSEHLLVDSKVGDAEMRRVGDAEKGAGGGKPEHVGMPQVEHEKCLFNGIALTYCCVSVSETPNLRCTDAHRISSVPSSLRMSFLSRSPVTSGQVRGEVALCDAYEPLSWPHEPPDEVDAQ